MDLLLYIVQRNRSYDADGVLTVGFIVMTRALFGVCGRGHFSLFPIKFNHQTPTASDPNSIKTRRTGLVAAMVVHVSCETELAEIDFLCCLGGAENQLSQRYVYETPASEDSFVDAVRLQTYVIYEYESIRNDSQIPRIRL